jgi:flavodoxin
MKNILVAYYSRSGNTQQVAQTLAELLAADILQITGKELKKNTSKYDLVIIATSVYEDTLPKEFESFLKNNEFSPVAFVCTYGWSGGANAFRKMESLVGKKPIATLEIQDQDLPAEKQLKQFAEKVK